MDFQSSLHNQQVKNKKKPFIRIGFLFLFGVSLSLNFYLLFFDGQNPVEIAKVIPPKEASINLLKSQAEGLAPGEKISLEKTVPERPKFQQVSSEKTVPESPKFQQVSSKKTVPESPKIKQVSFSKSNAIIIGDIAAKSL